MFSRLREHFGAAGLIVAIVALVAALAGGAIAATGGNGNGSKATASAKGKPGPRGKTGKSGPAGPVGPAGPQGPAGPKGDIGAAGANGAGVTGTPVAAGQEGCVAGGVKYTSASGTNVVCNGKNGTNGTPGAEGPPGPTCNEQGECLLPPGATETGVWSATAPKGAFLVRTAISFPLRLSAAPTEHFVTEEQASKGEVPECPGTSAANPEAEPGNLCLYEEVLQNLEPPTLFGVEPRSGSQLSFEVLDIENPARTSGVWAVTACPQTGCQP
jgi:hypothetical protein